ncbi:F-box protein cpr30 [Phtheirospermum japonicum]|uniref:F-box protein cpr30 n=1 Tax=Phtheirospermum japonicum TaxID=374723 RepID=A0A830CNF5_9LAMI|nr:F-box protein cpr30 [Phtheirospermum japonicum]
MSIGVLGGCLCLSYNDFDAQHVDLWVMRKMCGDQGSWSKEFVVDTVRPMGRPVYGQFKPLQVLGNGEIVILWIGNDLVCYDPRTRSLRYVGFHRLRLTPKAVALTPSFVPLKETLKVDEVLSRYVRPRYECAIIKAFM